MRLRSRIKSDGAEKHECVLLDADDALVVSESTESTLMNEIRNFFESNKSKFDCRRHILADILGK